MINLNKIRTLKPLEEMKKDLVEFITNPDVPKVYVEEYHWGLDDYESDKEQAQGLLEKVERRIKSLSNYLCKKQSSID